MNYEIQFPTDSPINTESISGQNKKVFDLLSSGLSIHCLHEAVKNSGIGRLNSRISDLKNKFKIPIEKKFIQVDNTIVVEYKLK